MIEQLSALPVFVQIVFVLGSLSLIAFILFIGAKFGLKLKGKGFSLSFGKGNGDDQVSPHSGCKNSRDALETLKRIREIEALIFEFKYQKSMKRQMDHVESAAGQAKSKLLRIYTSLLKRKGKDNPIKTDSCQSYMLILKIVEQRIIDLAREFMRENHFVEKTEQEFEVYIDSRSKDIRNLVTETLNDLYHFDVDIDRGELYDHNEAEYSDFAHIMRDCFIRCRTVATETHQTVQALEAEVEQLFLNFMP